MYVLRATDICTRVQWSRLLCISMKKYFDSNPLLIIGLKSGRNVSLNSVIMEYFLQVIKKFYFFLQIDIWYHAKYMNNSARVS